MKEQYLLQTGDVINLNEGQKIYGFIPQKYFVIGIHDEGKDADKLRQKEFVIGKVMESDYSKFDTLIYAGEYVVIKTESTGGGSDGYGGYYVNGHKAICKKLKNEVWDEDGLEVSFYQSGSFTAMIENIKPIRKMRMIFIKSI